MKGALSDYHLHVLLAPHLGNHGGGNTAWVGEFEGTPLLFAQRNDCALALACSAPWTKRSVGYVGSSDGWGDVAKFWPMVKKAVGYLARNGPVSPQDRWEEDPGYTPFTVAAEIAALLAAAELAELNHEASLANQLREIADVWNDSIERWMYMSATDWCRKFKVEDYYVRIAPKQNGADGASLQQNVHVKNVTASDDTRRARHLISPDALALVRFGLRAADDPRIRDTAKVIDALLMVETPNGATWHRYNDDGYGEHEDGSPLCPDHF